MTPSWTRNIGYMQPCTPKHTTALPLCPVVPKNIAPESGPMLGLQLMDGALPRCGWAPGSGVHAVGNLVGKKTPCLNQGTSNGAPTPALNAMEPHRAALVSWQTSVFFFFLVSRNVRSKTVNTYLFM